MRNYKRKCVLIIIALMVVSLISSASLMSRVRGSGENWLSGWSYRQKLTIQNATGAGTNYQIPITVLKTGTNSHCRDDFGDLRFTASDGSTLLDYWMQSVSTGNQALFWVNDTDNLGSSNSTIYMYYGNSGAATTSNGKATFQFFDNFSADSSIDWTNTWQSSTQSLYSLSGGNLVCGTASGGSQLIQTRFSFGGGFCASALVRETNSGGQAYFLMESSSLSYTGKDMEILAYNAPYYSVYLAGTNNNTAATRDTTNFFTMVHKCPPSGDAIGEIWLGSSMKVTYSHAPSYTTAHVGFLDYITGTELVQWVYIRKYVSPEPYAALVGNEESLPSLTVSVVGSGSVNLDNPGPYHLGDTVNLTAVPGDGWSFDHWSGDLTGSANPAALIISGSMSVTANFVLTQYALTVSVVGNGSVNSNSTGPYHYGDVVQLTAVPGDGWSFDHWSGDLTGSANPGDLSITGNMTVTAYFLLPHLYIDPSSINKSAGDVYTTFQTSIMIERIHNLWGFDFELTWNQSLISLANVNFNATLDNIWGPSNWFLVYNVTGDGYCELAAVATSTGLTNTTPVPLANLTFFVKAAAGQTPLHFALVDLSDSQSQSIAVQTDDGTYEMSGPLFATLYISPQLTGKTISDVGTYFNMSANIGGVADLFGFDINITWDNRLLTLNNCYYNDTLDALWGVGNWFVAQSQNGPGWQRIVALSTRDSFNSTGSQSLYVLEFHVEDPHTNTAEETPIHFETHKLSNSQWSQITHTTEDGLFSITGEKPTLLISPAGKTCRKIGEIFTTQINVTNAGNVEDFAFEIHYNTTLVDLVSVTWNAWGSGNYNLDEAGGNLTGYTFGNPINGNTTLLTITFNATFSHMWRDENTITGWRNNQTGTIYVQWANLSYMGDPDLAYVRGGVSQLSVGPDLGYTFSPIRGDIDNNGTVEIWDLRIIAVYYDQENDTYNLIGDPVIDIYDLVVVASNYGYTYSP